MILSLLRFFSLKDTSEFPIFNIKKVTVTLHVDDAENKEVIKFFKDTEDLGLTFIGKYANKPYIQSKFAPIFLVITDAKEDENED